MNRTFIILLLSFLLYGCESDLITILDEYNPPYDIVAIPGDGSITINFISGILASDFAGFNIYVNSFTQPSDAILGGDSALPTVRSDNHVREPFSLAVPTTATISTYDNGTLYTVALTAYGTNELADNGFIETSITSRLAVVPRPEGSVTVAVGSTLSISVAMNIADIIAGATPLIEVQGNYKIQYFGTQSNFTNITIVTNNNFPADFDNNPVPAIVNGVYVVRDMNVGGNFIKLWITAINAAGNITFRWAHRSDMHNSNAI